MKISTLAILLVFYFHAAFSQTAIQTSFETSETPSYAAGNLHNQNGWTLTTAAGTSAIVQTTKVKTGAQAVTMTTTASVLTLNRIPYSGTVPGITGDVYTDIWVNAASIGTSNMVINGYDLYGGSSKRIFMVDFTTAGVIRVYNGSSTVNVGTWVADQWIRVSVKVDFAAEKYYIALNAVVNATAFSFREAYTPTASGTRAANIKEFHSLRFTNNTETSVSTSNVTVDDIYIGTTAISDVPFGGSSTERTITVTQPAFGSIVLNPAAGPYNLGQSVTATLTIPTGYINNGWTGDLSGTALVQNFTVSGNMAFSANVAVDPTNPPPKYKITVNNPANGIISLSPLTVDSLYYKESPVTATITFDACYSFNGWTGSLSGTATSNSFTVQNHMTIGADIVLNVVPATKRIVSNVTQFKTALAAMNPGDSIEVNDGSYNFSSYTITRSGCESRPIIIYAKNPGAVVLNGSTSLVLKDLKYITLTGFLFQSVGVSTGIKLENSSKVRITKNTFNYTETSSCTWIYIGDTYASPIPLRSGYNRIDNNTFEGKTQTGNYIKMDGNIDQQTKYDTIDHNWFKNNTPRAANEKECIRVGVSTLSMSSGFTLIEYNLFQDCDGDPEVVSIKSCDNTVRYNTFLRCLGTLSLRHGNRNTVEGNYFFGDGKTDGTNGAGGIRVYGKDHKIINNYFQGLTGEKWDAAITITNGDVLNNSTSLDAHFVPENLVVAFNTLVNNKSNIEIGFTNNSNYNRAPINCIIANNIVVDNSAPIIKSYSAASLAGVAFSNNIMFPTGTSSIGMSATASQVTVVDPQLVQPICDTPIVNCILTNAYKVFRLSGTSPAIDAATGSYPYVSMDYERQSRTGLKDIGADEYKGNDPIFMGALDSVHVGPNATAFNYSYTYGGPLPVTFLGFTAMYREKQVLLTWQVSAEKNVSHYQIEWSVNGRTFESIGSQNAKGGSGTIYYNAYHSNPFAGKNYYRLKAIDNDGKFTYSQVRTINTDSKNDVTIYPNPAQQFINVNISGNVTAGSSFKLINAVGIVVKTFPGIAEGLQTLSVQGFPTGLYRLQLTEAGKATRSFTVSIIQ